MYTVNCKICGKVFKTNRSNQVCCCAKCSQENVRLLSKQNREARKVENLEKSSMSEKTDWSLVAKIQSEHPNLSYGQLVARGLL